MAVLTMVRVPGSKVPTLRCQGQLTLDTAESLRREVGLSTRDGVPGVIVNLDRVNAMDVDGVTALSELATLTAERGKLLVLVAGTDAARQLVTDSQVPAGIDVCRTEGCALSRLLP